MIVDKSNPSEQRIFARLTRISYQYAIWVILALLLCTALSIWYIANNLGVDTDTTDMLSEEVPFRANHIRYKQSFSQYEDTLLLVIDAPTQEQAHSAAKQLNNFLHDNKEQFPEIYYLAGEAFFEKNGLLFKSVDELGRITDQLASAQPLVARIAEDPSLHTFLTILTEAAEALRTGQKLELDSVFNGVTQTVNTRLNGQSNLLSWQSLLSGEKQKASYQEFIVIRPKLDYSQIFAAEVPIKMIRDAATRFGFTPETGIKLRITGEVALAHDEIYSAMNGAQESSLVALVLVAIVLYVALRSIGTSIAVVISLVVGLILTAAFGTLAVGHLNLISIAFAVLYIGLGVDYAIHFLFRFEEFKNTAKSDLEAIASTGDDMGQALLVCAITTAIGFYAFMPTAYRGVAELGLISGTGMLISFLVTMTLLPALQRFFPMPAEKSASSDVLKPINKILNFAGHSKKLILTSTVIAIIAASIAIPHIRFDYNLLNMNNPHAESVTTFQELLKNPDDSPWHIEILADNLTELKQLKERLEKLSQVKTVVSILDLVPENQQEKVELITEMAMTIGPISFSATQHPDSKRYTLEQQLAALEKLLAQLTVFIKEQPNHAAITSIETLSESLSKLKVSLSQDNHSNQEKEQLLQTLENDLLSLLPESIKRLQLALSAEPFTQETLPAAFSLHWYSQDDFYRLSVYPTENINDNDALRRFVRAVQQIAPTATGVPVISLEAGEAVVDAFIHAFSLALIGVVVTLLLMLRSIKYTLLALTPLLLATLFTGALTVLLDLPFNFANIIALPLLLGTGIDSSLHMVHRSRNQSMDNNLLHSNTARAVYYSALTTLVGFGSLFLSTHQGTASMGLLLTIGLSTTLICVLVILPALLQWNESQKNQLTI
ncbi:MAG TPA: MMPL family transporter [Nitrosomonas sp.]|nr:MMPL family transporter [Nitrosomonas sp.]HRB32046.1 MMPL family transporter [Nitrosomonas sp.]HRB45504.1 MMPL family transporter [Nitrosomonas sp.]HRB76980.1 MMPL family transporter [Nitrosomonas sp.]